MSNTSNVVILDVVRRERHKDKQQTSSDDEIHNALSRLKPVIPKQTSTPRHAQLHAVSKADFSLAMTLFRRFNAETEQLMGFMEKIGIGSEHSRECRKYVHAIKSDLLAVRVLRDQSDK